MLCDVMWCYVMLCYQKRPVKRTIILWKETYKWDLCIWRKETYKRNKFIEHHVKWPMDTNHLHTHFRCVYIGLFCRSYTQGSLFRGHFSLKVTYRQMPREQGCKNMLCVCARTSLSGPVCVCVYVCVRESVCKNSMCVCARLSLSGPAFVCVREGLRSSMTYIQMPRAKVSIVGLFQKCIGLFYRVLFMFYIGLFSRSFQ